MTLDNETAQKIVHELVQEKKHTNSYLADLQTSLQWGAGIDEDTVFAVAFKEIMSDAGWVPLSEAVAQTERAREEVVKTAREDREMLQETVDALRQQLHDAVCVSCLSQSEPKEQTNASNELPKKLTSDSRDRFIMSNNGMLHVRCGYLARKDKTFRNEVTFRCTYCEKEDQSTDSHAAMDSSQAACQTDDLRRSNETSSEPNPPCGL